MSARLLAELQATTSRERLLTVRGRTDLLAVAWSRADVFDSTVAFALEALTDSSKGLTEVARAFLDLCVARLLRTDAEVLRIARALRPKQRTEWLSFVVQSPMLDNMLAIALAMNSEVTGLIEPRSREAEILTICYGSSLLESAAQGTVEIDALLPHGIAFDRTAARALLGSALDEGKLSSAARAQLLVLFPDDKYFSSKLASDT